MARRPELFIRDLSDGEAAHLLKLARRSKNPTKQHRAMLLFASFQGQSVPQISEMHRASATHVAELIHAFNEQGFAALDPRKGGGRPRRIDAEQRAAIVKVALARPRRIDAEQRAAIVKVALARPRDLGEPFTDWSLIKLHRHLLRERVVPTISRSQLWRILHEHGIRFLHHKTWKASPDPDFEAKKNRVLDLYAHPPAGARVLCLDEFGPLNLLPRLGQGWARSQHPARFRATYTRTAGVRQLLAAYDPSTGRLYGHLRDRKTWREVRELLRSLRARFDEHLIVVLDDFSPHLKKELRDWAALHDIELVYLPTYSSWLNLIECQFMALRRFALNGSDYASHAEQDAAIHAYLRWHNRNCRPAKPWRIKAEVHHSHPAIAA